MNVRLVVVRPESKRQTFSVRLPIVIGRSEEAKFRIQQDRVSRRHCELFAQDGGVYLRDLGSTNGTFLNGELVETSVKHPLEPGATVRVGSLEFRIEFESEGAAAPVPVVVDEGDRTVGVARADDSERLQVEHAADAPALAAAPVLTAERPAEADRPPHVEVAADVTPRDEPEATGQSEAPPAADAFGFLAGSDESQPATDDDHLGDFLKGL